MRFGVTRFRELRRAREYQQTLMKTYKNSIDQRLFLFNENDNIVILEKYLQRDLRTPCTISQNWQLR